MKLEWIQLENFRQYFGKQRLTFSKDEQRNVTIVHGINGAGKTSLFLALNWCLYGRSVDDVIVVDNVGELVSKECLVRTAVGGNARAAVELSFLHEGERYSLRRAIYAKKEGEGIAAVNGPEDFVMMRTRADGQAVAVKNPLGTLNAILPANVREYFLFDAEKIDNFARPEAAMQVRQAIYLVLKLELLTRAQKHLEANAREYRAELRQTSGPELRGLLEQEERAREERDASMQRIEELKRETASARGKIAEIDARLGETQNAKLLKEQRERIEQELRLRRTELETTTIQIRDFAVGAHFLVARPAIDAALRILDAKRERGEIPSSIRQQFVQDLLEQGRCICGRCLEADSPERDRLVQLMRSSIPSILENDVLETGMALRSFSGRALQQTDGIQQGMQTRVNLVDRITELDAEQDDISRQLKNSPLEEISRLEANRQTFRQDVESYALEIGACNQRVSERAVTIKKLEADIAGKRKAESRERLLSKKSELAQQAADAIDTVYTAYADDMRQKIEARTKEIFKRLVWKESHFQDVRLGSDYNLEVIDRYGFSSRPELSAGERQVLSLSFITAMSRVSDEEAPLVIDTPFGRLSSHHRNSITAYLPQLAGQLVLFVTDEELRDEARENLQPRIGAEYRLEFDPNTSCTQIVEILA